MRFDWLGAPEIRRLAAIFAEGGEALHFVGGCVRDTLLARPVGDIDAATPALPARVHALLAAAGIPTVPTGLAHGTITALLARAGAKARPVEITSFRRDIETDGRHAVVAFGGTMEEDAARRDFTMNALYATPEGVVSDPTGRGLEDVRARRLRFVGEAPRRIREDALRLLRFWRFAGQLELAEWDAEARAACAEAAPLLAHLSGERIQAEMRKLLSAPRPARIWEAMRADGLLPWLVQSAPEAGWLDAFPAAEALLELPPQPVVRLAALLHGQPQAALWIADRWRLPKADAALLRWLMEEPAATPDLPRQRAMLRRKGEAIGRRWLLWHAARDPAGMRDGIEALRGWKMPIFPLTGMDLAGLGFVPGPGMGAALKALEQAWETADYHPSKADLLQRARALREGRDG